MKSLALLICLPGILVAQNCEDDAYQDCEERAKNGECEGRGTDYPYHYARWMLSKCRKSCKEQYSDPSSIPSVIADYGGVEDSIKDPFGNEMPLCSHNGGFTAAGRNLLLELTAMNKFQKKWVPKFSEKGYDKDKIPLDIYKRLVDEYKSQQVAGYMREEDCMPSVINCEAIIDDGSECSLRKSRRTFVTFPSQETLEELKRVMRPLAEKWAGVPLEHSATYGIRRYTNGSWLTSHVDRFNTHVISAILQIGQKVDEDWPLQIQDNDGNNHEVIMSAGEMVWYESARAVHGRMKPLKGEYFDNLFIHYKPSGQWYKAPFTVGSDPRKEPFKIDDFKANKAM